MFILLVALVNSVIQWRTGNVMVTDVSPHRLHLHDIDNMEEVLRQFDMNMKYGPCIGVPRLERWERASKVGLDPPQQVKVFLERAGGISDCLWEGRV